ncbi:MAG: hypothetical protein R3B13_06000 [Polyangiaceae bacterium]
MKTKIVLGVFLLALGCDSSSKDKTTTPAPGTTANWGNGKGDVANDVPEEGAPEAARSFTVDDAGNVYLLDTLNTRIVVFKQGKADTPVPLPEGVYDDLALMPDGGFALLDIEKGLVKYVDSSGAARGQTLLDPLGVPAAQVTALDVSDGVWTEVDGEYLVKVAGTDGSAAQPEATPATLRLADYHFSLDRISSQRVSLFRSPASGGARTELATVDFGKEALEWGLFRGPSDDTLRVLARVASTPGELAESVVAITLSTDGSEKSRREVPGSESEEECFRWARSAPNGTLYLMRFTASGVRVQEVAP